MTERKEGLPRMRELLTSMTHDVSAWMADSQVSVTAGHDLLEYLRLMVDALEQAEQNEDSLASFNLDQAHEKGLLVRRTGQVRPGWSS